MHKKIAVIFPGVGYHCDKPLLYYSAKLAEQHGCEVARVPYANLPGDMGKDPAKKYQCFISAREQAEDLLKWVEWDNYEEILFISKSVGTTVALSYAMDHTLTVRNILFTPLVETFKFPAGEAIAFTGTKDPWADTEELQKICEEKDIPLYITENANHSLERGEVRRDVKTVRKVMKICEAYLENEA